MGMGPGWAASGCAEVLLPTWRMALVSWVSNVARVDPVRSAGARPLASWAVSWNCRPRQHDDFLPARDFGAVRQGGRWREALQVIDGPGRFRDAAADRGWKPLPPPAPAPPPVGASLVGNAPQARQRPEFRRTPIRVQGTARRAPGGLPRAVCPGGVSAGGAASGRDWPWHRAYY